MHDELSPEEKVDYLIKRMPFRKELLDWCIAHPNFVDALKIIHMHDFVGFNGIITSHSPERPQDQVIGIVVYDLKREILKQDFIVDLESKHKEFTLYSKLPKKYTKLYEHGVVQHIDDFYATYGGAGHYYKDTHYPPIESLPNDLQARIKQYLTLTRRSLKSPPV